MVPSTGTYQGQLNCKLTHGPSGQVIETDAPVDNHGRGQAFSPTDLTAASLASCMVTTMAIAAQKKLGFDLPPVRWKVSKEMSADSPRRIQRLGVEIWVPLARAKDPGGVLEQAALNCPVHHSLNPSIECPVVFHWDESAG
jgi:putative redox protein